MKFQRFVHTYNQLCQACDNELIDEDDEQISPVLYLLNCTVFH